MRPDISDIRVYANGLMESYGAHSVRYADDMVRAYLANGDLGAVDVWRQVLRHLKEMNGACHQG